MIEPYIYQNYELVKLRPEQSTIFNGTSYFLKKSLLNAENFNNL